MSDRGSFLLGACAAAVAVSAAAALIAVLSSSTVVPASTPPTPRRLSVDENPIAGAGISILRGGRSSQPPSGSGGAEPSGLLRAGLNNAATNSVIIVGVCGASGSGKTSVATRLQEAFREDATTLNIVSISMDRCATLQRDKTANRRARPRITSLPSTPRSQLLRRSAGGN
jgi:hypothetical protein